MSAPGSTSPIVSSAASYWLMLQRITVWAAGIDVAFLLIYGALLGQFSFFWAFEKRFFNRLRGRK